VTQNKPNAANLKRHGNHKALALTDQSQGFFIKAFSSRLYLFFHLIWHVKLADPRKRHPEDDALSTLV